MDAGEQHVFAGTVRDNLTLVSRDGTRARDEAGDEDLWAALRAVLLEDWARSLPDGLDTGIGAGAVPVSPSAAQQLAVARLLLSDPHTLVLTRPPHSWTPAPPDSSNSRSPR